MKCSLARLGAAPEIRDQIDVQVARHHALVLRGFHVATHTALHELRAGEVPTVFDQNWWNRCFNSCGNLRGRRNVCTKDASIEWSIQELFGSAPPISSDYAWPFVNELSKSAVTMTQNMMGANFHAELEKAIRREVTIHEWESGETVDKEIRWRIVHHFVKFAVSHQNIPALPDETHPPLISQLYALVTAWKTRFSSRVPCCAIESFIYGAIRTHCLQASLCAKSPITTSKVSFFGCI